METIEAMVEATCPHPLSLVALTPIMEGERQQSAMCDNRVIARRTAHALVLALRRGRGGSRVD